MWEQQKECPGMKPGDILVTLDDSRLGKGETPLRKEVYLKTGEGRRELEGSSLLYARELRLSVNLPRCEDDEQIFQPLERREEELAQYRQARCVFRKNPDPDDNFYRVEQTGDGTVWINNRGERSLRFQTADGLLYRVPAGSVQPLAPDNVRARIEPWKILLDVDSGGGPLDVRIRAVHVLDNGIWQPGDAYMYCGDHVDALFLRVLYQDDCLGVFDSFSSYFLERPALEVLDVDSYGPARWHVRNLSAEPLKLCAGGTARGEIPADRMVYPLEELLAQAGSGEEAVQR